MHVVPIHTSTDYNEHIGSVSQKGQITLPKFIREELNIQPHDKISLKFIKKNYITIEKIPSRIDESYQVVPPLKKSLSLKEMRAIARDEHLKKTYK